jgi:hypothetical protein
MNVYASAGSAAKAQIELAGLFNQARKLVSENQKGNENAQAKDMSAGKAMSNRLQREDVAAQDAKTVFQYVKIGLAVVKLVGSAMAAGNSKEKEGAGETGKGTDSSGNKTDSTKVEPSAAAQTASRNAAIAGAVVAVGQQVVAAINAAADQVKNNRKRTTLQAEDAAIGSDMEQLSAGGRA